MTQPNTPTPDERGKKQIEIFDAVAARLLRELQKDGDLKAQLISTSLDFLRFTDFNPRPLVRTPTMDHLGAIIEETEKRRQLPTFDDDDGDDAELRNYREKGVPMRGDPNPLTQPFAP